MEDVLVLAQNEETEGGKYSWDDRTGERYQFPNQYLGRIRHGRLFVYYRGSRRAGGARGEPEYFGTGRVGQIWRDPGIPESEPKNRWRWFCSIDDYLQFQVPVPFRRPDGSSYEDIKSQNLWGVAVRSMTPAALGEILNLAGASLTLVSETALPAFPPLAGLVEVKEGLLVPKSPRSVTTEARASGKGRRSPIAKLVGDRAEAAAFKFVNEVVLPAEGATSPRWIADEGQKPGWDIQYTSKGGELIAVEVKGTTAATFSCIELTANEWERAKELGPRYWVYLVARCQLSEPTIHRIQDPCRLFREGRLTAQPTMWRLDLIEAGQVN